MEKLSVKIGDKFVSRNGFFYVVTGEYANGNYKMTEQKGKKKPVQKSVPLWAIQNNIRGGYWAIA